MKHQNRKIMLSTNVADVQKRIDDLISQFNERMKAEEYPTSISLHFYTSEAHPLTMNEVTHFLNSTTDILDGCDVEWSSETDKTLNKQIMIEAIFNNR